MKTLYLECSMGAAGDMLAAALLELMPDKDATLAKLQKCLPAGIVAIPAATKKCGVCGTHLDIMIHGEHEEATDTCDSHHEEQSSCGHHHHHHHTSLADIGQILEGLPLSAKVRNDVLSVYRLLALAEAKVHGTTVDLIHFHEVGNLDAIADIISVCFLINELNPGNITASPVNTGSGFVKCAHGVLPVPAPATAELLCGIPSHGDSVQGELCTPTGAALLKYFATGFGEMPAMTVLRIGYGMGSKDFPKANCVRAFLGEAAPSPCEEITVLECNLDDMTGEDIGFALGLLFEAGARDAFTVPIGMKKNRPGVMLKCVCMPGDADALAAIIMKHTTTAGIRRIHCDRYVLERNIHTVNTAYGEIRVKSFAGLDVCKSKPEYDDLAKAATNAGVSIDTVRRAALAADAAGFAE